MKSIASRITAVLLVFGFTLGANASCNPSCRFSFCPEVYNNAFTIGQPDKAFTTAICDPSGAINVGHVDSTGEAYIRDNYQYIPISQYAPDGLQQRFSPSFFKSYGIYDYGKDLSGIGHETPQTNQVQYLNNLCVSVPLTAYQVLDRPYGNVIDNRHPSDRYTDCVSFTTYVPSGTHGPDSPKGVENSSPSSPMEGPESTQSPDVGSGETAEETSSEPSAQGTSAPDSSSQDTTPDDTSVSPSPEVPSEGSEPSATDSEADDTTQQSAEPSVGESAEPTN